MKYIKKYYGFAIAIVILIGFAYQFTQNNQSEYVTDETVMTDDIQSLNLRVEIKGEIKEPGIYAFKQGDRIVDIINMAGGLTEKADLRGINRSERLNDEMVIHIPSLDQSNQIPEDVFRLIQVEIKGEVENPGIYKISEHSILMDLIDIAGGLTSRADTRDINLASKLEDQMSYTIKEGISDMIYVEIKGQINTPGVYQLKDGAIVADLIQKAGGLKDTAYTRDLNMASPLSNHQLIYIDHVQESSVENAAEIKGCVKNPGVYYFYDDIRLIDLVQMAGGFSSLADYKDLNLSQVISDMDVIRVPEIENEKTIAVDLKGQVKYPGVYYLKEGSRIIDLIRLAGGFRPEANSQLLNLSEILVDEQIVNVQQLPKDSNYIYVEIKGEVYLPGIYALSPETRLIMLLNRAGGLTHLADISTLNRTEILNDGDVIVIPSIEENTIYIRITGAVFEPGIYQVIEGTTMIELIDKAGGLTIHADLAQIDFEHVFNENTDYHVSLIGEETSEETSEDNGMININIATVDELQTLSGIGIIIAERIIEYRENNGPFSNIEEIMNVSGIGTSIYEQIKDHITV